MHKRLKRILFTVTARIPFTMTTTRKNTNMRIFGVSPLFKLQNNTTVKRLKNEMYLLLAEHFYVVLVSGQKTKQKKKQEKKTGGR